MNGDSFFKIGSTHHLCQDFALHGVNEERPFAIVSDGCSSAKNTDWGSRLLCNCLAAQFSKHHPLPEAYRTAVCLADSLRKAIPGLQEDCLFATLLSVECRKDAFVASVFGDGFIVARHRGSQRLEIFDHEYSTGAPYYPHYEQLKEANEKYMNLYGKGNYICTRHFFDSNGEYFLKDSKNLLLEDGLKLRSYVFDYGQFDLVAILSDGLKTFLHRVVEETQATNKSVAMAGILAELFGFKNYNGEFLQRRLQKAFKTFEENGWFHTDDFSMGVVTHD